MTRTTKYGTYKATTRIGRRGMEITSLDIDDTTLRAVVHVGGKVVFEGGEQEAEGNLETVAADWAAFVKAESGIDITTATCAMVRSGRCGCLSWVLGFECDCKDPGPLVLEGQWTVTFTGRSSVNHPLTECRERFETEKETAAFVNTLMERSDSLVWKKSILVRGQTDNGMTTLERWV